MNRHGNATNGSWTCVIGTTIAIAAAIGTATPTIGEEKALPSSGVIDTIAGTGRPELGPNSGPATEIHVGDPFGVEIGPDGALYIAEVRNHRVLRLDLEGSRLETVAGSGTVGYSGDGGPATEGRLNEPYEIRFDRAGNMYFVEMKNHLVRRVDGRTKRLSTVAGTGQPGFSGDGGPATSARLNQPHSIALDRRGGLYVADIGNHRIRRVDLETGRIETFAGNGERTLPSDGQAAGGHPLLGPRALFIDGETMWIALREGHSVWRMDLSDRRLRHVAGTGKKGYGGDGGPAERATFDGPKGIAVAPDGGVLVVDTENQTIRRIELKSGTVETIAGRGPAHRGGAGDGGPAVEAELARPHGICVGPDGTVYIGDTLNHRVRRIRP